VIAILTTLPCCSASAVAHHAQTIGEAGTPGVKAVVRAPAVPCHSHAASAIARRAPSRPSHIDELSAEARLVQHAQPFFFSARELTAFPRRATGHHHR
jgi:hypothetical protein